MASRKHRECRWAERRLPAYVAGELSAKERQRIERHLALCPACRDEVERLERALEALRATGEVEPPAGAVERAIAAVGAQPAPRKIAWRRRVLRMAYTGAAATLIGGLIITVAVLRGALGPANRPESLVQRAMSPPPGHPPGPPGMSGTAGVGERQVQQMLMPKPAPQAGGMKASAPARAPAGTKALRHKESESQIERAPVQTTAGGQPSSRPVAIKPGAIRPGPAREAVPPKRIGGGKERLWEEASSGAHPAGVAAARRETAGEGAPGGPVMGGPGGGPGGPPMMLSVKRAGAGAPHGWAVSDQFWQIRVDVPHDVRAGEAASLGVMVAGRSTLAGLWLRARDSTGQWLGEAVEVQQLMKGQSAIVSIPVTLRTPGRHDIVVVVRAEVPELQTEIPVTLAVKPAPPKRQAEVSGVFREVPLHQVVAALAKQAGMGQVEVPRSLADVAVDVDFSNPVPLEAALRILAEQVGAKVEKTERGYRFVAEEGKRGVEKD